jgi:exodeoxyribonuclease VII large subunit
MLEDRELARESTAFPSGVQGRIFTVSALARSLRDLIEHRFPLLWVSGEISNFMPARSGHVYFSLKDAQAQMRCVMFRSRAQLLDFRPCDGMQVEVQALPGFYEARGEFQLNVETMRPAGQGALFERFLRLRDRLAREGLFDTAAKRALPAWPRAIGIVTSTKAAALRDVLATLARRSPGVGVIVYPAPVQGEGAAERIAAAIGAAGRRRECDVLLLVRGGGSIEDLWAFNEEAVARAIRACPLPVVSGVGHETDYTIADFAADQRAPTPTAAAELVSPDRRAAQAAVVALLRRLRLRGLRDLEARMLRLDALSRRLVHPGQRIAAQRARLEHLRARLDRALESSAAQARWRLARAMHRALAQLPACAAAGAGAALLLRRLNTASRTQHGAHAARLAHLQAGLALLDPHRVLERGYSITRTRDGRVVTRAAQLAAGEPLDLVFAEGKAAVRVEDVHREEK